LELTDIVRRPLGPDEQEEKTAKITNAILDALRSANQGKIALDFLVKTKMDKPEISLSDIRMAFENKLAESKKSAGITPEDVLAMPVRLLEGTVKEFSDLTRAVIGGTAAVGIELKKAVEASFRREK